MKRVVLSILVLMLVAAPPLAGVTVVNQTAQQISVKIGKNTMKVDPNQSKDLHLGGNVVGKKHKKGDNPNNPSNSGIMVVTAGSLTQKVDGVGGADTFVVTIAAGALSITKTKQ